MKKDEYHLWNYFRRKYILLITQAKATITIVPPDINKAIQKIQNSELGQRRIAQHKKGTKKGNKFTPLHPLRSYVDSRS